MTSLDPREYLTSTAPGGGRRSRARSWLHTDAPSLCLDGDWRFRYLTSCPGTPGGMGVLPRGEGVTGFAATDYDDADWEHITLPANWVLTGDGRRGHPIYTNVQFPFPLDPPNPPDENPTGDHRRHFTVPASFAGMEKVLLRFDGVESRYAVWINGEPVGWGSGSRLVQEFDVTGLVVPGDNVIAVRVHQWSASSYVEDQDHWWLPGIFRGVTLLGRPHGGVEDVWIRTPFGGYAGAPGSGQIIPEIHAEADAYPITLDVPELAVRVTWHTAADVAPIAVESVEPWSAEQPRLYDATLAASGETLTLRLGFRSVRIDGDQLLANGRRLVFHGVNRPEINPDLGRVFDEEFVHHDLLLMKQLNVNAIRTAHYPPHPRFLDLCDELGFWVILENDLETHGFELDAWRGNPSDDPAWHDALLDRMTRTLERDKNHPSVVMWSLGNEAGTGQNLAAMSAWVHARDPERPVHYEGDHACAYTDVYSRMYASVEEVRSVGSGDSTVPLRGSTAAEAAEVRTKPFVLCEYVHAMGNGPGAIDDYEELVDTYPRLHGGFIWEWRDHGLRARTRAGVEYFAYGGDFGEPVHDSNFLLDGMLLSSGEPTPGMYEWAQVVAPIRLSLARKNAHRVRIRVENRRHSADASDVEVRWSLAHDGVQVESGRVPLPDGRPTPGTAIDLLIDHAEVSSAGESWLTAEAVLAADMPWAPAGHRISAAQLDLTPGPAGRPAVVTVGELAGGLEEATGEVPPMFDLGAAVFADGRLATLAGLPVAGPELEVWRAPTDNDLGGEHVEPLPGYPADKSTGTLVRSSAGQWREWGLDRLMGRVDDLSADAAHLRRVTRYAAASLRPSIALEELWTAEDDHLWLRLNLIPSSGWHTTFPRLGVRFALPLDVDEASWFGTGPRESYPDSHHAALVGHYRSTIDDLTVTYGRPQESGHRSDLRSLDLSLTGGQHWLRIDAAPDEIGRRPGFTLRRHTAQEVDAAAHPYQLPRPRRTYLWIDAAQHGLGSHACGPDVDPRYRLRPQSRSITLRFQAL